MIIIFLRAEIDSRYGKETLTAKFEEFLHASLDFCYV